MKCNFCGAELNENIEFCSNCGKSTDDKQKIAVPKKQLKNVSIIFIIICSLILLIATIFLAFNLFSKETKKDIHYNEKITEDSEIDNSSIAAVQTTIPEKVVTDWNTFECEYYENIPIGLLKTPDATSDIVEKYINERFRTSKNFEVKQIYNAYQSCEMVITDVFSVCGYKGNVTFAFDWNNTLYKIKFEFNDNSNVTPDIMKRVHEDIKAIIGTPCGWEDLESKGSSLKHKLPCDDDSCTCFWKDEKSSNYYATFSSYFYKGKSKENYFEFERIGSNKTNYNVSDNKGYATDIITSNGLEIIGTYHSLDNPYVDGTVTNNSNATVKYVKLKISLLDENGNVIDTTWTYGVGAEGLAPGETTKWIVYCSDASSIKISILN